MISNNDRQWCVYKHTNLINKKSYIGITSQKPIYRWGHEGHNYLNQPKFFNAINKYGWNNFLHEILFTNLSKTEALQKEAELIIKYDCINNGYNSITKYNEQLYSKEIYCVETQEIFPSVASAARKYNKTPTTLSHHLHGDKNFKLAYGKHWYFVNDELNKDHYEADYLYELEKKEKEKENKKIIDLYTKENKTIRQINNITGYSREKISKILKENNIEIKNNTITVVALDKDTLKPIKEFTTIKDACNWCGLNGDTATQRIHDAIIESWRVCKGYKWTTYDKKLLKIREEKENTNKEEKIPEENIIKDYTDGLTIIELVKKYNYCYTTISKILKKHNVIISKHGEKRIIQLDKDTKKIIQIFPSMKETCLNIGIHPNNPTLKKRCKDHKEYHGYIWYFIDDYEFEEDEHKYDF